MKYKNPLVVVAVVAVIWGAGGLWTLVHGQQQAGAGRAQAANGLPPVPSRTTSGVAVPSPALSNWQYVVAHPAEDPEMAQLAADEGAIAHEAQEILSRYAASDDEVDQKKIKRELREALTRQFDLQRKRRELEVTRIEERLRKLREQIKKRNDARETIIDRRLDQLVNEAEGLGWAPSSGAGLGGGQMLTPYVHVAVPATQRPAE